MKGFVWWAMMEECALYEILVKGEKDALQNYVDSIVLYLQSTYGDVLFSLFSIVRTRKDKVDDLLLTFLFTLNHEQPLKEFLLENTPEGLRDKTRRFFSTLHNLTETFLDHDLSRVEYLNECRHAWILA